MPPISHIEDLLGLSDTCINLIGLAILLVLLGIGLAPWTISPCGPAWTKGRTKLGLVPIHGPCGLPVFGSLLSFSHSLPHCTLASLARSQASTRQLMAFSLGCTPAVVTSDPKIAREILISPYFADRPIKQSANQMMFSRAIGFAPSGTYWRLLRRIAASHLFSQKRVLAHEGLRQLTCASMIKAIFKEQALEGIVSIRKHLQNAALNNIMGSVFGKRNYQNPKENKEVNELVKEGFELLGAFNWCDHLPWLSRFYDPLKINERCAMLVPRVRNLVKGIIDENRGRVGQEDNFVNVLLALDGEEKLGEDDMVAVLWEMIFRGTDTVALLTEWIVAELVLNQAAQSKLRAEIHVALGDSDNKDILNSSNKLVKLPYLQAVVKETLRLHPPGPLLSWARLSTSDVHLSNGMVVPTGTTAMVNMWAITHDPDIWDDPLVFRPERFLESTGGVDIDVRGADLRLAPFGTGRRVCPGKDLGLATVAQWVAHLVQNFKWIQDISNHPVDLSEVLKLSCEMKSPLCAIAVPLNKCFSSYY